MRHLDVLVCPVGSLALYLYYRFKISNEMLNPPDFTNNKAWYNIKLYTDGKPDKTTLGIRAANYADVMKKVFQIMGLPTKHTGHLGRILGPKKLEMLESDSNDIRVMGNWDPRTSTYSTKLPMKTIRVMAGFSTAGGMHYNPRTHVEVPAVLTDRVFPWVKDSMARVVAWNEANKGRKQPKSTAWHFLKLMEHLAPVVIQDVAVLKLKHPERCENAPLMDDPLFRGDDFKVCSLCVAFVADSSHEPFVCLLVFYDRNGEGIARIRG
jgi:Centromere DNA-binding protein complex CBF3 subunit, domain 2